MKLLNKKYDLIIFLIVLISIILKTVDFSYIIPRLLLFTGFRETTKYYWDKIIKIDEGIIYDHIHIPIIKKEDYTYELLKKASNNFLTPVLVKGLFSDTIGVRRWSELEYLSKKLENITLPVIPNAKLGYAQSNRYIDLFSNAFKDIITNKTSTKYLFFPSLSTININNTDKKNYNKLTKLTNEIVHHDLELERILWKGFGSKKHKNYFGSQIIIGRGSKDTEETTGTGWHCAAGNNWFIQVVGKKKWYFLNPKYSRLLKPLRFGTLSFNIGYKNIFKYHDNLPLEYAYVETGDLLYNPDVYWHTIKNYEGLTIGVPVREANLTYLFQNNLHFASIILVNIIFERIGINIGGYDGV